MPPSETTAKPSPIHRLFENRKPTASGLFLLGALLAGLALWLGFTWTNALAPVWLWSGSMAVLAVAAGLWLLLYQAPHGKGLDDVRLLVLAIGGIAGLLTVCLGLVLGYQWWNDILAWMQPGGAERTGAAKEQWQAGLRALTPMPILLVGLAAMFASLQLARASERDNAFMRRLLYGYNALLTSLLLLLVLVIANIFVGVKFPRPLDFTASSIYTLSDRTVNILGHLQKPSKFYVLLDSGDPIQSETQTLLVNMRSVSDKVQVEDVSPNPNVNPKQYRALREKYPNLERGVLIEYGTEPRAEYQLVKRDDLFSLDTGRMGRPASDQQFNYKGEDALMTELDFLIGGKKKPTVYLLQGHGELDIKDAAPQSAAGCGALKHRLEQRNFEIKPLELGALDAKVPDDAAVVLIAGPQSPLPKYAVQALEKYMGGPKGRLLVLVGPVLKLDKSGMMPLGLEPLLARFGVRLGEERVLSVESNISDDVTLVLGRINQKLSQEALVKPFAKSLFPLQEGTRPVQPRSEGPDQRLRAEALLVPAVPVWPETNLTGNPEQLWANYLKNPALLQPKLSNQLPLAVIVTEMSGPPPNPHMMAPPTPTAQTPRLAVFGNAGMACNRRIDERSGRPDYALLSSTLEWLRERPGNIGIEPKKRQFYTLPPNINRLAFVGLPALLIFFGIVGLGTGVWLVRRR